MLPAVAFPSLLIAFFLFSPGSVSASSSSEVFRTKAVIPIAEQDYRQAEIWLNKAVEADDEDGQAWYYLGLVESRMKNYAASLKALSRAETLGFDLPDLFFEKGYVYWRQQRFEQAASAFSQARERRPTHQRSNYYLGLSQLKPGNYSEALAPLRQAGENGGDIGLAAQYRLVEANYFLGRREEARTQLQRLLSEQEGASFFSRRIFPLTLSSAEGAEESDFAAEDVEPALSLLDEVLAANPQDRRARYFSGILFSRSGRFEQAVAALQQARQAGYPQSELELGIAYFRQQADEQAAAALQQAWQDRVRPRVSSYYLAAARYRLKQYPQALEVLEQAAGEDTQSYPANDYLHAEILYRLERSDEAARLLKRIIASQPESEHAGRAGELTEKVAWQAQRDRTYQLELSAGFLRDSNVGLYADEVVIPDSLEERADNRWQLALDGKWKPVIAGGTPVTFGYRFFQSRHQRLDQYDLRHHALSADWQRQFEQLAGGVNLQYSMASLGGDAYVKSYRVVPNAMFYHGQHRASVIRLSLGGDTYDYDGLSGYDGNRYQADYRHYWVSSEGDSYYLGALLRREDTDDATVAYNGAGAVAGLSTRWQRISIGTDLQYQRKQYPNALLSRDDDYYKVDLALSYPISPRIKMDITASRIENVTDVAAYDYSRTLYGLSMRWQL